MAFITEFYVSFLTVYVFRLQEWSIYVIVMIHLQGRSIYVIVMIRLIEKM